MNPLLLLYDEKKTRLVRGITAACTIVLFYSTQVNAADTWGSLTTNVGTIVCGLFKLFWGLVGPLAVLVFAIAAVEWIISRDDPGKRKKARDAMIVIIIGVLLIVIIVPLTEGMWKSVTGKDPSYKCK